MIYFLFLSDEGPMLEMFDYTIRIGSTTTFLYFDLYIRYIPLWRMFDAMTALNMFTV